MMAGVAGNFHIDGDTHNAGLMMVYIPKEKILVEADDSRRIRACPLPRAPAPHLHVNWYKNAPTEHGPTTIAPLHGVVVRSPT